MTVTPEQIEDASFSTVKRGGYRTEEVDRFLRTVADDVRALVVRVRSAEGTNEDLEAASADMAALMRDVHAQLGEKKRVTELELEELRQNAEREAAGILSAAAEQADGVRSQSDRVLMDAEHHAELLRSDGEQRVREQAAETLRAARAELQELLRRKHEVLHALSTLRADLAELETGLESAALSADSIDDSIINQTLTDLREAEAAHATAPPVTAAPAPAQTTTPAADETPSEAPPVSNEPPPPPPPPPVPQTGEAQSSHPAASGTFFSPPDPDISSN